MEMSESEFCGAYWACCCKFEIEHEVALPQASGLGGQVKRWSPRNLFTDRREVGVCAVGAHREDIWIYLADFREDLPKDVAIQPTLKY